ncbi:MAG TPA: M42 family metallopeptidase [Clostridia bacterium]|nr:M42 family metallopeptidase [Clostridia bacterium]
MSDLLKRLTAAGGVSGDEGRVRAIIIEEITPLVDEVHIDRMGNVTGFKKGTTSNRKVMLCAHMDEVGFIITGIEDNGMLKFATVGSIDSRILPSKRVRIGDNRVPGVMGIKAIHLQEPAERKNAVKARQMYIDIGAGSKDEAERLIKLGDYAVFDSELVYFGDGRVKSKALDDRVGCLTLIESLKGDYPFDLYACFTVQEEVGLRGAKVAAYHIQPDIGLVVEGTTCSDVPGVEPHRHTTRMGNGPAISIADLASYGNKEMVTFLIECAENAGIPFQIKEGVTGGNDAGEIQRSRGGAMTAVISVPCRYIHSPSSVMDLKDLDNTVRLVKEFLKGCESL